MRMEHLTPALSYGPFISRKQAQAQGLKHYYTGKPCKRGHVSAKAVSGVCLQCRKAKEKQYEQNRQALLKLDPEKKEKRRLKHNEASRAWNAANPEARARNNKAVRAENPEKLAEYAKRSFKKRKNNGKHYAYTAMKRQTDLGYRIKNALFLRLWKALKCNGARKVQSTLELLGCSVDELNAHLEDLFEEGMTWDNYGEWHIDHIRPCASFDLTDPDQQKQCFHYTNLQPLWAADNFAKSDKWEAA